MDQLLLPNLMFEEELSGSATIGNSARNRVAELVPATAFLQSSGPRSVLIDEDRRPSDLPECLSSVEFLSLAQAIERVGDQISIDAWGWSQQARDVSRKLRGSSSVPSLDAVIDVNRRQFLVPMDIAVPLEADFPVSHTHPWENCPSFSRLCTTLDSTAAAIAAVCIEFGPHWLLKSEISQAGRNRIKGEGHHLNSEQVAWLSRRFSAGEAICVEPWVNRVLDLGVQFQIDPVPATSAQESVTGTWKIRCLGVTQLMTDRQGQYAGTRLQPASRQEGPLTDPPRIACPWKTLREVGLGSSEVDRLVAWGRLLMGKAADRGYFGPAGIDAMIYRDRHARLLFRPANDLNARYTMGRLALEISARLDLRGESIWMFVPGKLCAEYGKNLAELLPKSVRMEPTSAGRIGQRPVSVASLLISSDDIDAVSWAFAKLQSLFVSSASSS